MPTVLYRNPVVYSYIDQLIRLKKKLKKKSVIKSSITDFVFLFGIFFFGFFHNSVITFVEKVLDLNHTLTDSGVGKSC